MAHRAPPAGTQRLRQMLYDLPLACSWGSQIMWVYFPFWGLRSTRMAYYVPLSLILSLQLSHCAPHSQVANTCPIPSPSHTSGLLSSQDTVWSAWPLLHAFPSYEPHITSLMAPQYLFL